jgi:hypothetical protein
MSVPTKVCSRKDCSHAGQPQPVTSFASRSGTRSGLAYHCRDCERARQRSQYEAKRGAHEKVRAAAEKAAQAELDRQRRVASDFEALRPTDDLEYGGTNDGRRDPNAGKEKKQEYSRSDGDFLQLLQASGGNPDKMPPTEAQRNAYYLALKSEQERRYQGRRLARSEAVHAANEGLQLRMMMQCAQEYFHDKVQPSGYARKGAKRDQPRTVVTLWSDQHFRSDLAALDNPTAYGAEEESRCFAKVVQNVLDYKSDHRNESRLLICDNGDNIDGQLGHDLRSGAPLVEQKMALLSYRAQALQALSAAYPHVHVEWQPGNHGRDKWRHPGRATASKWDGHEWFLGYCLAQMCAGLPNVTFNIPFRAVSTIELYGHKFLQTHGDTEVKLGDPDTRAEANEKELAKINASLTFGHRYILGLFGHFHKGRFFPWQSMRALFNGALVPANGHARASGYVNERRGQWLFEATKDHPIGDLRFIEVDETTDRDASLNKLIKPFRIDGQGAARRTHTPELSLDAVTQ